MNTPDHIKQIAARRVAAFDSEDAMYARRDQLRTDLETRGTSAVALEELRLLEEALAAYEDDLAAQQQAEIDAENGYVRYEENRYVPGEFGENGEGW